MQTKTELIQFTKEEIDGIWNLVKNLIRKACIRAGGFVNEEHIKEYCKQGKMQLWVVITETNEVLCVCVTEIRKYPNYSVCDTKIVTGKRYKEWFASILNSNNNDINILFSKLEEFINN